MSLEVFEVSSRSRRAREGGWRGWRRNYKCRQCDKMFQVDTRYPLPETERVCQDCQKEGK